ncbi:MAG: pantoate--beta-alanine ligase [Bifidobacteriaceae bacterium]|jgi:pantoate--beta-alanine ligase|nr:pantoate--beta-alanine ligase [Bifidobacteriaceae bacterium]
MMAATPNLAGDQATLGRALAHLASPRCVVMTMGALHAGHLDLVDAATAYGGSVVVTVFVNPLQFGPGEDFDAYPRTVQADCAALAGRGVDVVYAPTSADMYPGGEPQVSIVPGPAGERYEGKIRPGHFAGVLTVVAKLLGRTRADIAVFGQKDAQQVHLIRQMVHDLDLGVEIVTVATRRDPDGLAASSRNAYLTPAERQRALALPRALHAGAAAAADGVGAEGVRCTLAASLDPGDGLTVDYLDLVGPDFVPLGGTSTGDATVIGAIRVGTTRLIDNMPVTVVGPGHRGCGRARPLPLSP